MPCQIQTESVYPVGYPALAFELEILGQVLVGAARFELATPSLPD